LSNHDQLSAFEILAKRNGYAIFDSNVKVERIERKPSNTYTWVMAILLLILLVLIEAYFRH
jgi:hypothetical protein